MNALEATHVTVTRRGTYAVRPCQCLTSSQGTVRCPQIRELEDLMADADRLRALPRAEREERTAALRQHCAFRQALSC